MEHCKGGDLFKVLMMKGGTLDEAWVCKEACPGLLCKFSNIHLSQGACDSQMSL